MRFTVQSMNGAQTASRRTSPARTGAEDDELAEVCDGLFRADEQDSGATEAYDMAFEEMAAGGMGAWRLCAEYEDEYDEDSDEQRIRMEAIPDADTCVFFDPNARRYDKRDAKYWFCSDALFPSKPLRTSLIVTLAIGVAPSLTSSLIGWDW